MAAEATDGLVAYLGAIAPLAELVAGRIHGGELPPDAADAMPIACVVVSDSGGLGDAGDLPLDRQRVDVKSYGATPRQAKEVAVTVHAALRALRRQVMGSVFLHSATPSGGFISAREPKTRWPLTLRTYVALYDEREVN